MFKFARLAWLACFLVRFPAQVYAASTSDLTADQWRSDLRYLYKQMAEKHKDLYHSTPKATFDAAVASLDKKIPELTTEQIEVELARLVAMVGDGHTVFDLTVPFGIARSATTSSLPAGSISIQRRVIRSLCRSTVRIDRGCEDHQDWAGPG